MNVRFVAAIIRPAGDIDGDVKMLCGDSLCDLTVTATDVKWNNSSPQIVGSAGDRSAELILSIRETRICEGIAEGIYEDWTTAQERKPAILVTDRRWPDEPSQDFNEWPITLTIQPGDGSDTIVRGILGETEDCDLTVRNDDVVWVSTTPDHLSQRRACEAVAVEMVKHWKRRYSPTNKVVCNNTAPFFQLTWNDWPDFAAGSGGYVSYKDTSMLAEPRYAQPKNVFTAGDLLNELNTPAGKSKEN